jgi:hypothetical protein
MKTLTRRINVERDALVTIGGSWLFAERLLYVD